MCAVFYVDLSGAANQAADQAADHLLLCCLLLTHLNSTHEITRALANSYKRIATSE